MTFTKKHVFIASLADIASSYLIYRPAREHLAPETGVLLSHERYLFPAVALSIMTFIRRAGGCGLIRRHRRCDASPARFQPGERV